MPSATLIHPAVWPQQTRAENWGGGSTPFWGGEPGPHLTQCCLSDLPACLLPTAYLHAYFHTKWHLDPCSRLTAIDMGRKLGDPAPLLGRGERGPHRTESPLG